MTQPADAPAFPSTGVAYTADGRVMEVAHGMTLRQYAAIHIAAGLCANPNIIDKYGRIPPGLGNYALVHAENLIAALEQQK